MGKVLILVLLIVGLLLIGLWSLTAFEDQRAQRLQAQATLGLVHTVQATNLALISLLWGGSLVLGAGIGISGYVRWRQGQHRPIASRQRTDSTLDFEAIGWAYRLGQRDTLQALHRETNHLPIAGLPTPTAYEDGEEKPWELPGTWF